MCSCTIRTFLCPELIKLATGEFESEEIAQNVEVPVFQQKRFVFLGLLVAFIDDLLCNNLWLLFADACEFLQI